MTEPDKAKPDNPPEKKKPEPRRPGGKTKRGPNKWLLQIFRGYDASGKRIYFSETFHGGSLDADNRLVELRNSHRAGSPMKFTPKLFKDFFEEWLDDRDDGKRREATIEHYRSFGGTYLTPVFGRLTLADITDVAIKRFYKDLRKRKLSPHTITMAHVLLTSIFKPATKRGLVLTSPMNEVDSPRKPKPKPVAMTAEETQKFLDAASSTPQGFMFRLAYFLGARPCEYLGLMWKDLDFKAQRITIERSLKRRKGGE
jgi:integrase